MVQAVPSILDSLEFDRDIIANLSKQLSPEDVQLFYQIALIGKRDMYLSPSPQGALEMTLLRMLAFKPAGKGKLEGSFSLSNTNRAKQEDNNTENNISSEIKDTLDLSERKENWSKLVANLNLQGVTNSLASNCSVQTFSDKKHNNFKFRETT